MTKAAAREHSATTYSRARMDLSAGMADGATMVVRLITGSPVNERLLLTAGHAIG
jgi:hypothetical protein